MLEALKFAADKTAPTATTWWFAPLGGFLAALLLWIAGVPMTFSEWLPNAVLRSAFEALICVAVAYVGIFIFWLTAFPTHSRFKLQGGVRAVLRQRLGAQMGPFLLMGTGFFAFSLLTGAGLAWLAVQVLNGTTLKVAAAAETPNTVGSPDFSLQVPDGRYKFKWDPMTQTRFDIRLDTQRNPDFTNNPAFILRNKTNTVAYNASVTWKSEIAANISDLIKAPKLSKFNFEVTETRLIVVAPTGSTSGNFGYYLDDSPTQVIPVIAKEAEVYFPPQLWVVAALYFIDKMPAKVGESSEPFIARVTLNWETAEGKKRRDYRVRVTATNSKITDLEMPVADAFLNFSLQEIAN